MSRIGNKSIEIPDKVTVNVGAAGELAVEGPKGKLHITLPRQIKATINDKTLAFARDSEVRQTKALHGLARSLAANMITGVTTGYSKDLEIQGVGFKAVVQGTNLNLNLGKSHPILFPIPAGIKVTVADNTKVKVEGIDKQLVGQVAADIRGYYPPEPYKGKGVRYAGENVQRKEGKTVQ
jgi:large subunit ribosomal protein L6